MFILLLRFVINLKEHHFAVVLFGLMHKGS